MRILINKTTGALIEAQSHATAGTLVANAVAAGMSADDVIESEITDAEYDALRKSMEPKPDYSAMRSQAYRDEADPLFFKYNRQEGTRQEWLDKVTEIKARWPE